MPDKLPNYIFSREKDREVSSTEARVGNLFRRLSSTRKRRRSHPKPRMAMSAMTAPLSAQASHNGPIDENSPPANPNALDVGNLSATDFGDLNDKIQEEVGRLEASTETVNIAILNLAKVFREKADMIRTVGERWDRDQNLEKKVRRLSAANKEMWQHRHDEEDELKTRMSELEEEAKASLKQKQTYEWKTVQLNEDYKQKHLTMEREHEKARDLDRKEVEEKKIQLEKNNADRIAALEKQKIELEDMVAKLQRRLRDKEKELDKEKENDKRLQESLFKDIEIWKGKYEEIVDKYAAEEHPPEYYVERYQRITGMVKQISMSYFTNLPESAKDNPTATSDRLGRKAPIFLRTPILESQCSQVLRLANVQHIIFETICGSLWQPFLSEHLLEKPEVRSVMADIYSRLAAEGDQVQRNWKVSALRILEKLDMELDFSPRLDFFVGGVIETLRPVLDDRQVSQCHEDLCQLFRKAIELGKTAERDRNPVQISRSPSLTDSSGWLESFDGMYEAGDAVSPSTPVEPPFALCVAPKVYRSATAELEEQVLCAGSALFSGTGIFQQGREEWERIKKAYRDVAISIARERKASTGSMVMISPTWQGKNGEHL